MHMPYERQLKITQSCVLCVVLGYRVGSVWFHAHGMIQDVRDDGTDDDRKQKQKNDIER